jgi:hypothetical protein
MDNTYSCLQGSVVALCCWYKTYATVGLESADCIIVTADVYIAATWLCTIAEVGEVWSVTAAAWKEFCVCFNADRNIGDIQWHIWVYWCEASNNTSRHWLWSLKNHNYVFIRFIFIFFNNLKFFERIKYIFLHYKFPFASHFSPLTPAPLAHT